MDHAMPYIASATVALGGPEMFRGFSSEQPGLAISAGSSRNMPACMTALSLSGSPPHVRSRVRVHNRALG